MHSLALRMVDEQSVLVLLRPQLRERLVLEDRPLDDLHYFVLVEDARAQLGLDEALNLRRAQYCLCRAWLQLTRPHVRQIATRDDASVGCSRGSCALLLRCWLRGRLCFLRLRLLGCDFVLCFL